MLIIRNLNLISVQSWTYLKERVALSEPIDRFNCQAIKNKSKTIQWIKSRNCDVIGKQERNTSPSF